MNVHHAAADAQVVATTRKCHVYSATLTAGSDAATLVLKDGDTNGTTKVTIKAATAETVQVVFKGLTFSGGVYADVTGTAPAFMVEHD